jgi:hypothetical protein
MAQNSLCNSPQCQNKLPRHYVLVYLRILFHISVVVTHQVRSLSQTLNNELVTLCPTVDILDIICCGLEVAGCVVALGDEDVVVHSTLKWLIQWNRGALRVSADPKRLTS